MTVTLQGDVWESVCCSRKIAEELATGWPVGQYVASPISHNHWGLGFFGKDWPGWPRWHCCRVLSEGVLSEGVLSEGVLSEGVLSERVLSEAVLSEAVLFVSSGLSVDTTSSNSGRYLSGGGYRNVRHCLPQIGQAAARTRVALIRSLRALEEDLIHKREDFLLAIGSEVAFIGRQKRLIIGKDGIRDDLLVFPRAVAMKAITSDLSSQKPVARRAKKTDKRTQ